jgi:hypothetical protein
VETYSQVSVAGDNPADFKHKYFSFHVLPLFFFLFLVLSLITFISFNTFPISVINFFSSAIVHYHWASVRMVRGFEFRLGRRCLSAIFCHMLACVGRAYNWLIPSPRSLAKCPVGTSHSNG